MTPDDFEQRPGEEPVAWYERLILAGMGEMTAERRIDLAPHIRAAKEAAGLVERAPAVRPPEAVADSLIDVDSVAPGAPCFIRLKGPSETVRLGPYENPALAYKDAGKVWRFLTEVIREARRHEPAMTPEM